MAFDNKNPLYHLVPSMFFNPDGSFTQDMQAYIDQARENPETTRGTLFVVITANGLTPDAATAILDMLFDKATGEFKSISRRSPWTGYPPHMAQMMWQQTRKACLKWIDANCPELPFRAMFEP